MGAMALFFTPSAYAGDIEGGAAGANSAGRSCLAGENVIEASSLSDEDYQSLTQPYHGSQGQTQVVSDMLFISYRPGTTLEQKEDLCERWGFVFYVEDPETNWALVSYGLDMTVQDAVAQMLEEPIVADVEPNYLMELALVPNDPYMQIKPVPWQFQYYWYKVRALDAWERTTGYYGTPSIIMDVGFDRPVDAYGHRRAHHEDFADYYMAKFGGGGVSCVTWKKKKVWGGYKWYVDCRFGPDYGDWRCPNFRPDCWPWPEGIYQHGTAVTGIFSADTNNGKGIAGGTWHATIIEVRLSPVNLAGGIDTGSVWLSLLQIRANYGDFINTVNMSFAGTDSTISQALRDALDYLQNARYAVVVAAAGNQATDQPRYPAAHPFVLSVGALTPKAPYHDPSTNDCRASFSNYGSWVRSSAYGTDLVTTDVAYPCSDLTTCEAKSHPYALFAGTSGAAPMVAALSHLVKYHLNSWTNPERVKRAIVNTSRPYPGSTDCPVPPPLPRGRIDYNDALLYDGP